MPKTGEKCTYAEYYKYSDHLDRSTIRCHPSFDEKEIALQVGHVFPPVIIYSKDVFWIYVRAPKLFFEI